MNRTLYFSMVLVLVWFGQSCKDMKRSDFDVDYYLNYCVVQATKTIGQIGEDEVLPRNIATNDTAWNVVGYRNWTSGFWPGILWYIYEYTKDEAWKEQAAKFNDYLTPLSLRPASDHDLGFQVFCSFGHGYRLTEDEAYKELIIKTSDTLATLYNPKVGTILSWPGMGRKMEWPHNTIIDNMMNLEMLFWAAKNGGNPSLYDLAVKHAETTMMHQFRQDGSHYHVCIYDTISGERIKGITHQGYADETMWARGQAWAIYGYVMTYRETGDQRFLNFAQKVADVYLERLPEDLIPYWDFDAPSIPDEPKDASAAAITASALFELSGQVENKAKARHYRALAEQMLRELSSSRYISSERNPSFLLHSTGHWPNDGEVDHSIIYADYYYIEALMRLKTLTDGGKLTIQ